MKINKKYLLLFLAPIFFHAPAYAYAGPGAAIGAIIVALTVFLAFFASIFLGTFDFFKKLINKGKKNSIKEKKRNK